MINGINALDKIFYMSKPSFKSEKREDNINLSTSKPESSSADALAIYNKAEILFDKKLSVKPLLPTVYNPNYAGAINGERIYTSDGKLYSIVDENEYTKTIYTPNDTDTRFLDSIVTIDKATGHVIRRQNNRVEDGKYSEIDVNEYSAETGDIIASSTYEDGKLTDVFKYIYNENGDVESISYRPDRKMYYWDKDSADGNRRDSVSMSQDLKFADVRINKINKDKEIDYEINFYNGGMISHSETKTVTTPNLLGQEPLMDPDLKPAPKSDLEGLPADSDIDEGEKTYYSNGAVESIIFPFGTIHYTPDGVISQLSSDEREVKVYNNGTQVITEKLGDDKLRTTTHYNDGSIEIKYENGDFYKCLFLNNNKKPLSYCEGNVEQEEGTTLYYNKHGMLQSAYNF